MKKTTVLLLILLGLCVNVQAQSDTRFKNHNLIFNGDIAFGNLYTMAASSVVTGLINYHLLNDAFFENSFAYGLYSANEDNLKVKTLSPMGVKAYELFNNVQVGIKVGYQTYNPEFFNCGIYASVHYKLDQFEVGNNDDNMRRHRAQRILLGATGLISLGSMSQPSRVIIEAGLRYSLWLSYKSPEETCGDQLQNGLTSHFAVKLASRGMLQNIGIYADINHFNMWKKLYAGKTLDNYTFGITWTITPQQADQRK